MDGLVFRIDGDEFPFDSADSITMNEAIILHDYSGLTLDQLEDVEGFNPKVIAAFMHIAIVRKMPDLKYADVRKKVGAVKVTDLEGAFVEADDARPPEPAPTGSDGSGKPAGSGQRSGGNGNAGGEPIPALSVQTSTGSRG